MRLPARLPLAVAVSIATVLGLGGAAVADGPHPYPSKQQVDRARDHAHHAADDVATIRHRLHAANARLDRLDQRAEIASERYNAAMWRLSLAKKKEERARRHAAAARQRVVAQRSAIAHLVVQSYQNASSFDTMTALFSSEGPLDVMSQTGVVNMAGDSMQADYHRYTRLRARADRAEQAAEAATASRQHHADAARSDRDAAAAAVASAQSQSKRIRARKDDLVHALARAQHISVSLARQRQQALAEIARKKAEAAARRKAEREAAAAAAAQRSGSSSAGDSAGAPAPPSSGSVSAVIAYAKAQLGKWYRWAAAGPDTFDCSGLTMMAWRQAGVYLPHFSGAQYDAGTPIPVSAARPGDLYFWSYNGRPSGIHHVALAIGGGSFIEAPHTGARVRYNNVGNWYPDFAVRLR